MKIKEEEGVVEFKITVEELGEKLFFFYDDLYFDRLRAFDWLAGGSLKILRDGEIWRKTNSIRTQGTHAASVCFCFDDPMGVHSALLAEYLQQDDTLILQAPFREDLNWNEFSFADNIRRWALERAAFLETMEVGEFKNLGEAFKDADSFVEENAEKYKGKKVIEFLED